MSAPRRCTGDTDALREIDRDDPLSHARRGTPASHISSSKIVRESRRSETPYSPWAVSDSRISSRRCFGATTFPANSQAERNHEAEGSSRPKTETISMCVCVCVLPYELTSLFPRAINNLPRVRWLFRVAYKISLRYRAICIRDRETRYPATTYGPIIFSFYFFLALRLTWQQINVSVSGIYVLYLHARVGRVAHSRARV